MKRIIFLVIVTLLLIGLAFPGCGTVAPFNTEGKEVTALQAESSENVTTHNGDLIIDGYEEFVIENCTWIQKGNIYVKAHGELIVRNATLQVSQTYLYQYEFKVQNFATVSMEDAELASDYGLWFHFLDDSEGSIHNLSIDIGDFSTFCFFERSRLEADSMVYEGSHGMQVGDYAEVSVTNSVIGSIEVLAETPTIRITNSKITWRFGLNFMRSGGTINITDLTPGYKEYLDLNEKIVVIRDGSRIPIHMTLGETPIQEFWIKIHYNSNATISDSTLQRLVILVSGISCSFENLKPPFSGEMHTGQIVLNRTQIMESIMIESYDDAEVTIISSMVNLILRSNSHVYSVDSVIDGMHVDGFIGSLGLNGTTLRGGANVLYSNFFISGDGGFKDFNRIEWHESNVTRNYGVIVNDVYGNPVSDASLALKSEDGMQIWNSTTDSQGRANFDLTFTDSNYTGTLKLRAVKGDLFDTRDVTFLSDTPVVLTALAQYNLTISSTTGGNVTTPGQGTFTYDEGKTVNLVASPASGYKFVKWTGNVTTIADVNDATTIITMNGNYSITANFEETLEHSLTISSAAGGSVTTPGEGDFTYEEGAVVGLEAEPDEGYQFVDWTGDVDTIADVNAASTRITMNDNYSITANFAVKPPVTPETGCFIATAAYGTPMAEEIQILREFRDEYLLTNPPGQELVDIYYTISPPIADFITDHPSLKPVVRAGLMPVVAMCSMLLDIVPQFAGNEA